MLSVAYAPDQFTVADWDGDGIKDVIVREYNISTSAGAYMVRKGDNTLLNNDMPSGISGSGNEFTGGM